MPTSDLLLPITALYAALTTLWLVALSVNVIRNRWRARASIGDGGNHDLKRAIRAHGNATEYLPLFVILLAILELNGTASAWLHGIGITMIAGRVLHGLALHLSHKPSVFRFLGMTGTFGALLMSASLLISRFG